MISTKHKFLFIHIPKTGGNSLQNILKNYSEEQLVIRAAHQDGIERFEIENNKYNTRKHSTLSEYQAVVDSVLYAKLFKFSTLRNPWDRLISYYFSPHRGITEWNRQNFIQLIDDVLPVENYLSLGEKELMPLDKNIDFLIRFEQLNEDFNKVCRIMNIPEILLPKRNQSKRQAYTQYYDDELKQRVATKFIKEIEFGEYEF